MLNQQYDYVFLGAGCATISLVLRMLEDDFFKQKRILIIDESLKKTNDRTWCFWESKPDFFEDIVYKKWSNLVYTSDQKSSNLELNNYQYKMIRGIDFYNNFFKKTESNSLIDIVYEKIENITFDGSVASIKTNNQLINIQTQFVFNSVINLSNNLSKKQSKHCYLLQHFKGWMVETETDSFNATTATLMDFDVDQKNETVFVYTLPITNKKAFVEYTVFGENLIEKNIYETELKKYVEEKLHIKNYKITEVEFGVIPMTTKFFNNFSNNIFNIGTVGGQTKSSSGYTFKNIQKNSASIITALKQNNLSNYFKKNRKFNRHQFYDNVLLEVLSKKGNSGKAVFTNLFNKNKGYHILQFLDNETTLLQEIKIMNNCPKMIFIKAALREIKKMFVNY